MGHRVAVMRKGELQQVAPPQELYDSPVNVFVGGFIGSPAMNMLEARIEQRDGGLAAVFGDTVIALDEETLSRRPALAAYASRDVVLGIRPEDLDDAALVGRRASRGSRAGWSCARRSGRRCSSTSRSRPGRPSPKRCASSPRTSGDDRVLDQLASGAQPEAAALVGRFSPRTRVLEGDVVEVVDPSDARSTSSICGRGSRSAATSAPGDSRKLGTLSSGERS